MNNLSEKVERLGEILKNYSVFIIIILTLLVYINSTGNNFTNWDDNELIVKNQRIRELTAGNISDIFLSPTGTDYLPVKELSYALTYSLWRLNPFGYHLDNIIIYILNVLLVFLILEECCGERLPSLLGSLLFAFHPLHVESVTWLSGRKDLLSGFFLFLSFYLFIRYQKNNTKKYACYFCSVISFILALMSKPTGIVFPFLLILYFCYFHAERGKIKTFIYSIMPFCVLAALFCFITIKVASAREVIKYYPEREFLTAVLTMAGVFYDYLRMLFFPFNLSATYDVEIVRSFPNAKILVFSGLLTAFLIVQRRKNLFSGFISFCVLWFLIALVPVSNIIPISVLKADRYLYIPSFSLSLFLTFSITRLHLLFNRKISTILIFILLLPVICFSILTVKRNLVWENSLTLWRDTLEKYPGSVIAHYNLANYYFKSGSIDHAIEEYKISLRIRPDIPDIHNSLGIIYSRKGKFAEAVSEFESAIRCNSKYFNAYGNLGLIYNRTGRNDLADKMFRKVLELDPENSMAGSFLRKNKGG